MEELIESAVSAFVEMHNERPTLIELDDKSYLNLLDSVHIGCRGWDTFYRGIKVNVIMVDRMTVRLS